MNKTELHELCKGCKSYASITLGGEIVFHRSCMMDIPFISSTNKCPCMDCIIKTMCSKICDDYIDFNIREAKERARIGVLNDEK